jgi:polyisoprenoid-binding protein YceI
MRLKTVKTIAAVAVLAGPLALGALVVFHPGVAFGAPRFLGWQGSQALPQEASFTPDPMHTCVGFEIGHLGLSKVQGRFTKFTAHIVANKAVSGSSVEFTIKTDSVDTAVAPRDADLRSANFFDAANYPDMVYKSTSIRKSHGGYVADGTLTIKGVSKPVSIPFKVFGPIKDPWGNQRIGILADPITIKRSDYGMTYDLKMPDGSEGVGDAVTIRLSVEATQDK